MGRIPPSRNLGGTLSERLIGDKIGDRSLQSPRTAPRNDFRAPQERDRAVRAGEGWRRQAFGTAIELPDQAADAALRGALGFGERIELVNHAFAMNPAQTMKTDIQLARVVADDHGVGEKAVRLDAAQCGGFGGDQHGIGMDLQGRGAEQVQVCAPGRPIGEDVRGPPAFPQKVGDVRADRQILHDEARIVFEARTGGRIGLEVTKVASLA